MNHRGHREHRGLVVYELEQYNEWITLQKVSITENIDSTQLSMFSRCSLCLGGKSFFKGFKEQ